MRGADVSQPSLFVMKTVSDFVPKDHPLRALRALVDEALAAMDDQFDVMYAEFGRASIAPERLIRASLLQIVYTIRSERQLVEHIHFNMLYRWFVGLEMEDAVWHATTFTKNRARLLEHDAFTEFFEAVVGMARKRQLLSDEHFSVDGSLVDAWASQKSFRPRDEDDNPPPTSGQDFRGEKRSNDTHQSRTDPEAELMRKSAGTASRLSYGLHNVMENRHGLVVATDIRPSATVQERDAAIDLLATLPGEHRKTVGADKGFDTHDFVAGCRGMNITPHVARNEKRSGGSAIDARTTSHVGYNISLVKRKLIETHFGWAKQYGGLRRPMLRGLLKMGARAKLVFSALNLIRMRRIEEMCTA